jgi:hypothetical protein
MTPARTTFNLLAQLVVSVLLACLVLLLLAAAVWT